MTTPRFGYSLYGDHFSGSYATREAALAAAVAAARSEAEPPLTVYVGRLVAVDPEAAGHAEHVIARMRDCARATGVEGSELYLRGVTETQEADLDRAIAAAVGLWLQHHNLMPGATDVQGVSEHPVPATPMASASRDGREVATLGTSDYAGE